MAFPARFKRGDVDDQAAARIGAFAKAYDEYVFRDFEILNAVSQREAVRRDDADIGFAINEALIGEVFWVDHGVINIGEDFEIWRAAAVIAV